MSRASESEPGETIEFGYYGGVAGVAGGNSCFEAQAVCGYGL